MITREKLEALRKEGNWGSAGIELLDTIDALLNRNEKLEAVVRYVKQYAPKGIPELESLLSATEPRVNS